MKSSLQLCHVNVLNFYQNHICNLRIASTTNSVTETLEFTLDKVKKEISNFNSKKATKDVPTNVLKNSISTHLPFLTKLGLSLNKKNFLMRLNKRMLLQSSRGKILLTMKTIRL